MNLTEKAKGLWETVQDRMAQFTVFLLLLLMPTSTAYAAGGIAGSQFVKGTLKMLNDGASGLKSLAIAGAVVCIIAYGLLKMFADDMEDKGWNKRIRRAIIGCIIVLTASALVEMFTGYYV